MRKWRLRFAESGTAELSDARRPGRWKANLLTGTERDELARWARREKTSQALALRAGIVLACAEGRENKAVAAVGAQARRLPGGGGGKPAVSQVYSRAGQQVHGLVKSARAGGGTRADAAGRRASSGCPGDGRRVPVQRGTARRRPGAADAIKPDVSNRHGQTIAMSVTPSTRSPKRPQTRLNGARRTGTCRPQWAGKAM